MAAALPCVTESGMSLAPATTPVEFGRKPRKRAKHGFGNLTYLRFHSRERKPAKMTVVVLLRECIEASFERKNAIVITQNTTAQCCCMSGIELGKALSSRSRLEILRFLSRRPMSVEELSQEVSLKTITVRHHVNLLKRTGLVEEYGEERRKIGRPVVRYQATQKPLSIQYPTRQYELLSEILVQALLEAMRRDKAGDILKKIGRSLGERLAREITEQKRVTRWNIDALRKHIVEEHLSELGAIPEIIDYDSRRVQFRMHNCIFRELALKYPDLVCEKLDEGLMETLLGGTVGKAHVDQSRCVAHGDKFCEYVIKLGR